MSIDRWLGFSLSTDKDHAACRSWFPSLISQEDTLLLAEGYERDDGSMPKVRVLLRRPDGRLREAIRSKQRGGHTLTLQDPSPGFLKRAKSRGLIAKATGATET